ncbi:glycosyltransferase [Tepidibacter sp. Z1-5]|uniref:glycosyltransferase n=1 Tax=Tepidibacter sp. Z1-5 TaxID=3134138 RepID=UPI0030C05756
MNNKKICFISCVNDEEMYNECLKYIEHLNVPDGYEIQNLSVRDAKSITSGYNEAMKASDAKYKIYLHQDVFIINKNFLFYILDIFKDDQVGLIGAVGAKKIPTNGIWWESNHKYGKVYESHTGKMELLKFKDIKSTYEKVKAIDGFIMVTQHDIQWREDIFDGWDFYDVSQSVEFSKKGYEVVVPTQDKSWFIHDCGYVDTGDKYEKYRTIFLDEYSKEIYPLVSVVIPSYNRPYYLEIGLKSVLNQTYKNIEIVISDDSTNDEVYKMLKPYINKHYNIRYYKNTPSLGVVGNFKRCFELAKGEFVNYLIDDDIFHIEKIEKMVNYFLENDDITLVTSHRQTINDKGDFIQGVFATEKLFDKNTIVEGKMLKKLIARTNINFIGEPTTVLFRKKDLDIKDFGVYGGRRYRTNTDISIWFNLLSKGKAVYISDTLSYFRIHDGQDQKNKFTIVEGIKELFYIMKQAYKEGILESEEEYKEALYPWFKSILMIKQINDDLEDFTNEKGNLKELYDCYDEAIKELLDIRKYEDINLLNLSLENMVCNDIDILDRDNIQNDDHIDTNPLVSVLIPAYNRPHYLEIALKSVLNQTYKNIEIIICDDSTNDKVKNMIHPYLKKYKHIRYYNNGGPLGGYGLNNVRKCLNLSEGKFINFLMDDDVFHESKIETMIKYFIEDKHVSLVTSYRKRIDGKGNYLEDEEATKKLYDNVTVVDGKPFIEFILKKGFNYIGEPSTVLFKKSMVEKGMGVLLNKQYMNLIDVATWIELLSKGKMIYIPEALSYFRIHEGQNQNNKLIGYKGIIEWFKLINDSYQFGLIKKDTDYKYGLYKVLRDIVHQVGLLDEVEDKNVRTNMYIIIRQILKTFLNQNRVNN